MRAQRFLALLAGPVAVGALAFLPAAPAQATTADHVTAGTVQAQAAGTLTPQSSDRYWRGYRDGRDDGRYDARSRPRCRNQWDSYRPSSWNSEYRRGYRDGYRAGWNRYC
ncbi:hypothetical protein [Streptomyces sp. NPDC001070]